MPPLMVARITVAAPYQPRPCRTSPTISLSPGNSFKASRLFIVIISGEHVASIIRRQRVFPSGVRFAFDLRCLYANLAPRPAERVHRDIERAGVRLHIGCRAWAVCQFG